MTPRRPRSGRIIKAFGESKSLSEWARDPRCTVNYTTLWARLRHGASAEQAMTEPLNPGPPSRNLVTAFGESKSLAEWSRDPRCTVTYAALRRRLQRGGDVEAAMTAPADTRSFPLTLTVFGETKTLRQWARDERCRVKLGTLTDRIRNGWDAQNAVTLPPLPRDAPRIQRATLDRDRHPLAVLLHEARIRAGFTQAQVAEKIGSSESLVEIFENGGKSSLTLKMLEAWARALGGRLVIEWGAGSAEVRLAPRERQVLALIARGHESTEIGEQLGVTERTVREYRKSLYEKLGAHSSGQAVAVGIVDGHITVAELRPAPADVRASG